MGLSDKFAMMIKDHDSENNVDAKEDDKKAADDKIPTDTKIAKEEAVINEDKEKEEKDLIDAFSQTKI